MKPLRIKTHSSYGVEILEISRQKQREATLKRFKYIQTCVLARELCLLIRTNRASLSLTDVEKCCSIVAKLCKEAGCIEQSELCRKAAKIVRTNEEEYLELCKQSCMKCGEARRPTPKNKTTYVA